MDKRILIIFGALLVLSAFFPFVKADAEAIFQWESDNIKDGEVAYLDFYQNFEKPYNFTIVSDLVDECWITKDYHDENRIVCRSELGLCKSLEPIEHKYIKCKTWNIYREDNGKKAILLYEYEDEWGRQNGIYQTQGIRIPTLTGKIISTGPFMIALIASLVVLIIILILVYFIGGYLISWLRDLRTETSSYEELKTVKEQIGKKGQIFPNCIVIY